ncbi:MAG TPA: dienelactone hydrolase family protein [Burkholderiaceae bacterium]|nr:dienelactone hydrolase family protein [Burkholderiaceae bacterium]
MIEHHIDIPTADGAMNTFVVCPDEGGPFPVVLFYMDAPGKREELHDMARRIAAVGYFVVLPNLYYRRTRQYELKERTEANMAVMFEHMNSLGYKTTVCDTEAMLKHVDAQPQADKTRIGAVGYCMSGPFVVWAGAAFPERLRCIASIYGANMVNDKPNSPHRMVGKLRGEAYFACAEIDKWASKEQVAQLQAALQDAGVKHRVEWYPGAEHGFAFPQRAVFHKPSAERHWVRLFDLFERCLRKAA